MEGVRQVEVDDESRMEETLRSVVAVRPEVVVVSTIPDRATAALAAQLASSVLVVASLPAQTTAQALAALLQAGVSPNLLAGSLAMVSCQRLVRVICRICRRSAATPAAQTLAHHGIGPEEAADLSVYRGKGCPTCNKVGYRGRRAIFELLTGAPEVRAAVTSPSSAAAIEEAAIATGMTPLRRRCLALVREGITTFDEFVRLRL
jgi:type IV pilus assembly protein PilB